MPRAAASFSVKPTNATCGSVNTTEISSRSSVLRGAPGRAMLCAAISPCVTAMWTISCGPVQSPAAKMCGALVCILWFVTTYATCQVFTPAFGRFNDDCSVKATTAKRE